jgi:hypothetical protein
MITIKGKLKYNPVRFGDLNVGDKFLKIRTLWEKSELHIEGDYKSNAFCLNDRGETWTVFIEDDDIVHIENKNL